MTGGRSVHGGVIFGAVVLAAGQSRRMGGDNKLLADLGGKPVVRRVCETVAAAVDTRPLVVVGHQAAAVGAALAGVEVGLVYNADFATGLSGSIRAGIRAVSDDCDGVFICLGDMPQIATATMRRLAAAFDPAAGTDIVAPTAAGRRGNPVLWGRAHFPALMRLHGDAGARGLLAALDYRLGRVVLDQPDQLEDIDTPADLAAFRVRWSRSSAGR